MKLEQESAGGMLAEEGQGNGGRDCTEEAEELGPVKQRQKAMKT